MNLIKLGAISSTNAYMKQLLNEQYVENFTVVTAENQTNGKGQMGAVWHTEEGKNLTFTVLVKDLLLSIDEIFNLNAAVSVSIIEVLEKYNIPALSIKWPNDILSGNKKIGGILIENSIKNNGEIFSVIGIGLNVNQRNFEGLEKASSLSIIMGKYFEKDILLNLIIEKLKRNIARLLSNDTQVLWLKYQSMLYKKGIPMPFDKNDQKFMGIIQGVTKSGKLEVLLEDDTIAEYEIKEVKLLY